MIAKEWKKKQNHLSDFFWKINDFYLSEYMMCAFYKIVKLVSKYFEKAYSSMHGSENIWNQ